MQPLSALALPLLLGLAFSPAAAQFGRRNAGRDAAPAGTGAGDVDLAMQGWAQLAQQPEKLNELLASMKNDPEVMAKAQEMLKDPTYMAAAKAKVAELEARAKARGLLDESGMPVPGAATATAMGAAGGGAAEARDWEMENIEKHKAGLMNDAELGMANLKQALNDPAVLSQTMQMMRDPNTMAEVQKLMQDPAFKAQAQQMMEGLKASGGLDMEALARQAAAMAGSMGGGGSPELERLRRENAALKSQFGIRDEL